MGSAPVENWTDTISVKVRDRRTDIAAMMKGQKHPLQSMLTGHGRCHVTVEESKKQDLSKCPADVNKYVCKIRAADQHVIVTIALKQRMGNDGSKKPTDIMQEPT